MAHVHAALIKQWADGALIEYFSIAKQKWERVTNPAWDNNVQYRAINQTDALYLELITKYLKLLEEHEALKSTLRELGDKQ